MTLQFRRISWPVVMGVSALSFTFGALFSAILLRPSHNKPAVDPVYAQTTPELSQYSGWGRVISIDQANGYFVFKDNHGLIRKFDPVCASWDNNALRHYVPWAVWDGMEGGFGFRWTLSNIDANINGCYAIDWVTAK